MARPKLIEDNVLLDLIKKYFYEECNQDIKKLKYQEIATYVSFHGYPGYPATTLRRTTAAVKYIDELKKTVANDNYIMTVSYQTIDAALLVDSNRSRNTLIKAITDRDNYYKTIADAASRSFERYTALTQKYDAEVQTRKTLEDKIAALEEQDKENTLRIKTLEKELKVYKSVVETYVYPEVANELLLKEGAIRKTDEIVKPEAVEENVITPTTDIKKTTKSGSKVIEGLFKLDD